MKIPVGNILLSLLISMDGCLVDSHGVHMDMVFDVGKCSLPDKVTEEVHSSGLFNKLKTKAGHVVHYKCEAGIEDSLTECKTPKSVDRLLTMKLLGLCIKLKKTEKVGCYPELGCFSNASPWNLRGFQYPPPNKPKEVGTTIQLFNKRYAKGVHIPLWPRISIKKSNLTLHNSVRLAVFITHGWLNEGSYGWLVSMRQAFLKKVKGVNVFVVDWKYGANDLNYYQAASNTRIVGAELVRFGKYLVKNMIVLPSNMHLIGHSLGAHIFGYMAKGITTPTRVYRLTALDPARPGFENFPPETRVSKSDAHFVDVIHTDAGTGGYGITKPVGKHGVVSLFTHADRAHDVKMPIWKCNR